MPSYAIETVQVRQPIPSAQVQLRPVVIGEAPGKRIPRRLFEDDVAIGQPLRTDDQHSYVVVGVVPDVRSAFATDVVPTIFAPIRSESLGWSWTEGTTVLVRGAPGHDAMPAVRRELSRTYPGLTIFDVRTMDEHIGRFELAIRYNVRQFGVLGLFGLALGVIGLAGVTSYAVARRRREIGIRLARGARSTQVLWLVLHEATALTLVGALAGSAGGVALSRALSALDSWFAKVFSIGDAPTFLAGVLFLFVATVLAACCAPAYRATRIDPASTLRSE